MKEDLKGFKVKDKIMDANVQIENINISKKMTTVLKLIFQQIKHR